MRQKRQTITRIGIMRTTAKFGLLLIVGAILLHVHTVRASTDLSFTSLGTNPSASSQSTANGKQIKRLKVFNNKLYSGYGDWLVNTGPIQVRPYDLDQNQFLTSQVSVPTEAIENLREINGKLYSTTIDPTCSGSCASGYAVGEPWTTSMPLTAEHLFDMSTLTGTDLWAFGGSTETALAWRSTDNGANWNIVQTENRDPGSDDSERYYWGAELNGKMYMQSDVSTITAGVRIFDGTSWSTGTADTICKVNTKTPSPVVFAGHIICNGTGNDQNINLFDGTNVVSANVDCTADDYYVEADFLYVLCGNGGDTKLVRTKNLSDWQTMTGLPTSTTAIAVDSSRGQIYIGTTNSELLSADLPEEDTTAPTVSQISILTSNGTNEVNLTANFSVTASDNDEVSRVEYLVDGQVQSTTIVAPYTFIWQNLWNGSSWQFAKGEHTVSVRAYDSTGNVTSRQAVISVNPPPLNVSEFNIGSAVTNITTDAENNVWFTSAPDGDYPGGRFGKISSGGVVTYFEIPDGTDTNSTLGITSTSDGAIWFVGCTGGKVIRFTPGNEQYGVFDVDMNCQNQPSMPNVLPNGNNIWVVPQGGHEATNISPQGDTEFSDLGSDRIVYAANIDMQGKLRVLTTTDDFQTSELKQVEDDGSVSSVTLSQMLIGYALSFDENNDAWVGDVASIFANTKVDSSGIVTAYATRFKYGESNSEQFLPVAVHAGGTNKLWFAELGGSFGELDIATGASGLYFQLGPFTNVMKATNSSAIWVASAEAGKIYRLNFGDTTPLPDSGTNEPETQGNTPAISPSTSTKKKRASALNVASIADAVAEAKQDAQQTEQPTSLEDTEPTAMQTKTSSAGGEFTKGSGSRLVWPLYAGGAMLFLIVLGLIRFILPTNKP